MSSYPTVLLILGVPTALLLGALIYVRKISTQPDRLKYYEIVLFGHRWTATRASILQLVLLVTLVWWLDWFLPFSFAFIGLVVGLFSLAKTRELSSTSSKEETAELLEKLSSMQKEIGAVQAHVQLLGRNVALAQSDLEGKEELKEKLEAAIQRKSEEAKGWEQMTETQRQAFLETAVAAMSKESRGTFWWGLILGFFINLLAALAWALLGNPGKDELLLKVDPIARAIGIGSVATQKPVEEQAHGVK